ncbi:hypothetical protein IMCC12053_2220 [Celeribacter marinus]|uniref:Uncharacterized protein n=1 Tax=Celeribacter marinus TaxID=1397108 RepID=A0A0P0ABD3_9RHOB|nr:hypothetical protein IMCC12053_2220 [Celeribacter marinus]
MFICASIVRHAFLPEGMRIQDGADQRFLCLPARLKMV